MLLQHLVARHNLADTMLRQLALEEPDKHISGHRVELDAAMTKEADLLHACTVSRQRGSTRGPVSRCLDGLGIQPQRLDVGEPQSKVDNVHVIVEAIAATVGTERAEDAEARHIEVVRDEHLVNARGEAIQQQARGRRGHALGRHDGDVEPLCNPRLRQQRVEPLFLNEQDGGVSVFRSGRWRQGAGIQCKRRLGHRPLAEILPHFDRAERHLPVGVCLDAHQPGFSAAMILPVISP